MKKPDWKPQNPWFYGAFPVCRNYTVRAYVCHTGPPERRGCKNRVRDAGPLLGWVHTGHLCPCNYGSTEEGSGDHGRGAGGIAENYFFRTGVSEFRNPGLTFHILVSLPYGSAFWSAQTPLEKTSSKISENKEKPLISREISGALCCHNTIDADKIQLFALTIPRNLWMGLKIIDLLFCCSYINFLR